jgi:ribosomal protein L14E/L6E/L27E
MIGLGMVVLVEVGRIVSVGSGVNAGDLFVAGDCG